MYFACSSVSSVSIRAEAWRAAGARLSRQRFGRMYTPTGTWRCGEKLDLRSTWLANDELMT